MSDEDLERVHSTLMSPLVWDLGHIAAFEDLWLVHRFGGRPLLRDELVDVYDAFETPRAGRGELPFLAPRQAREYMAEVRARTLEVIAERGIGDGFVHEIVVRHEQQHNETMLQTLQLARLRGYSCPAGLTLAAAGRRPAADRPRAGRDPGRRLRDRRPASGFAYDNERPRHRTDVRGYLIGRAPITNASYLTFVEGGGYERREWWSDEGWAWKEEYDITRPGRVDGGPDAPSGASGGSSHSTRIGPSSTSPGSRPTPSPARTTPASPPRSSGRRRRPGTRSASCARRIRGASEPLTPGVHANVDQLAGGPPPAGAYPAGASPYGCLGMIGDVWEWTASDFAGYPGSPPIPYREYSEVFFGTDYRVLRGGSWATRARVDHADVPQLGLPAAPADLLRPPDREGPRR